jgi:hypothetical protein
MFTDEHRRSVCEQLRQLDLRAFEKLLTPRVLSEAAVRAGLPMGRGALGLANLAWLSVACAFHATRNFADVLVMTLKLLGDADRFARCPWAVRPQRKARQGGKRGRRSKHDPRGGGPLPSEEAFAQARGKAPLAYWTWLILLLGEKFAAAHEPLLRWHGRRLLALDGTTLRLQNYKRLREHFGTAANSSHGRKGRSRHPQARMVMLTFPLARMPWKYELCPLGRSEKTCAASLLCGLECGDLVLMDRGFWSYGLFCQVAAQRACFAIRLFGGAKLKTVAKLGLDDRLARYQPCERKWKKLGLPRSMDLRVIRYRIPGFRPSALLTNLTDRRIGRRWWVGLATHNSTGATLEGVYHRRWEIETTFCELKVRQRMEDSLRGRTPQAIEYEVAGHVLLYLLTRWLMVEAAAKAHLDPLRLSYLHALNELTDMAPLLVMAGPQQAANILVPRLMKRLAEHVVPKRPGRHYPRPGDTKVRYKGRGHYHRPSKLKAGQT